LILQFFLDLHSFFEELVRNGGLYLINLAKKRVFEEFGIELEEEIKIV